MLERFQVSQNLKEMQGLPLYGSKWNC